MRTLRPQSLTFTFLLGALVTLASFATDMALPVLVPMAASLGVAPATAALTMSVFMGGFALAPLVMGPVSDRFGRRPLLLLGCTTFSLFGALGAFAHSLPALLLWRTLMGVGAGTVQVLVTATIRDHFSGAEARVRQSYVSIAAGLAPVIAPTLGVWVAALGGWRAIYGALAGVAAVLLVVAALFIRESAPGLGQGLLTVRGTLRSYSRVVRHPVSMGYACIIALCFGCLFAYVSGSSLILMGVMGIGARYYGALFAATSAGFVIGSFANAFLNRRGVSHSLMISLGLTTIASLAVVLLLLALTGFLAPATLIGLVIVSHVAHSIVRANSTQGALEPMPEIAGVASAVLTGLQMIVGAAASAIAATLFDGRTAIAMTATMSTCAVSAFAIHRLVVRPAERRMRVGHERVPPQVALPQSLPITEAS